MNPPDYSHLKAEIDRITHNLIQTERYAQIEEKEVLRLNALLNRILGDEGPDLDAYLDGHVEAPSVPKLHAEIRHLRSVLEDFAEYDCAYGDNCPSFGTRHGRCVGCKARKALGRTE